MNVTSRFRPEYWIMQVLGFITGLGFLGLYICFALENEQPFYRSSWFWMSCLIAVVIIFYFATFLFVELKIFTINEKGISVRYLLGNRKSFYTFDEITHISARQTRSKRGGVNRELEIELKGNRYIKLNALQYENYDELKTRIHEGRQGYF